MNEIARNNEKDNLSNRSLNNQEKSKMSINKRKKRKNKKN